MSDRINLARTLLIATPTIEEDTLFHGSLVYVSEHKADRSVGLIVNKPSDITVSELLKTIGITEGKKFKQLSQQPVYVGGPVNTSRLYILYPESGKGGKSSPEEEDWLKISTSEKMLEKMADGKGPRQFLVMLGCSIWSGDQLEEEFLANSWVALPSVSSIVFDEHPEQRALLAARHLGFNLKMMHG